MDRELQMGRGSDRSGKIKLKQIEFRLFLAGNEPNSLSARRNLERMIGEILRPDEYRLEVIDVLQDTSAALKHRVLIAPMLEVRSCGSRATLFGSLSDPAEFLMVLGLSGEGRLEGGS